MCLEITLHVSLRKGMSGAAAIHLQPGSSWKRLAPIIVVVSVFVAARGQVENDVRLVNGPNAHEGRLEIFKEGVWLSVCRSYTSNVANVICRQLKYPEGGASLYYANSYGSAPGETLRDYITCNGGEATLSQCAFSRVTSNCDPIQTIGVSCDPGLSHDSKTIRLANGTTPYEGRIEVFDKGVWGFVTDSPYSDRQVHNAIAAGLACRLLFGPDYGGSVVPKQEASVRFGVARGRAILLSNIMCKGNEKSLFECQSSFDASTSQEDSLSVVCKTVPRGCNGYLEASTGNLTSPGYPQSTVYTTDTDCVWKIVNKVSKIRLSFTNVNLDGSTSTTSNQLQVFDSNGYLSISSVTASTAVTSTSNEIYVWLKVPAGSKGIQFHAYWDTPPCFESISSWGSIRSPGYPQQYPTNVNCTYHLLKRKGLHISISFNNFALSNMVQGVCGDSLQVFDGDTESSPSIRGPMCSTTIPADITTTNVTSTKVIVKFTSDGVNTSAETGFEAYFNSLEPDPIRPGNYTEDSGTFKTPGYPNVYNDEEDVIWTITTKPYKTITINFHHVYLKGCCDDYIMIYDRLLSANYFGGNIPSFATDTNFVQVTMKSSLDNKNNIINASWTTECRQVFTASSGSIMSPNDPTFDLTPANCTYIIRQQAGYYITLQFSTINLEKDQQCSNYIEIHDGSTDLFPRLGERYCGQTLPPTLNSTQNIVLLKFRTQGGKNSFRLTYSSHPKECSNGLMTDSDGSFTSPGFPLGYPSNTYCVWTINLDLKDLQIELTFDDFSVGSQGTQCQYAFVRVYDSDTVDASKVMTTLCGTTLPPKLRSSGHSMTVVLNVFGSLTNANGFRATYASRRPNGGLPRGLFSYGTAARDRTLGSTSYETMEVTIEDGFPFGDNLRDAVYVGTNGIISFQKGPAWPRLDSSSLVVCVYCAYISNIQGVYYHLYNDVSENRDVLEKASGEVQDFTGMFSFRASTVLVVTWDRVQQSFPSRSGGASDMGDATFQVALVTDGAASYAIVQYRVGHMTWRYPGRWYSVEMGVAKGSVTTFQPNVYSGTEYAYDIDKYFGNTGYKGSWIYELGQIPSDYRQVCREWHNRNKAYEKRKERETGFDNLPKCPCSRRGFFRHIVNQWRFHRSDEQNHFECYILNVARTRLYAPLGKECCYSTDPLKPEQMDLLITSRPFAGASLAYNPLIFEQTDLYETEDRQAHVACCLNSPDRFCRRFYQLRPVGDCDPAPGLGWSPLYGDPHVTTLDGRQYIFNGLGEFTMATVKKGGVNFTLQARTQRAELRPGTPTNGTVFTAVGAEENGVRVFLQLDPNTNTTLILFANDIDYTRQLQQEGESFVLDHEGVMIVQDNNTCVLTFPSGIGLQISVSMKALAIGVSFPSAFKTLTKGLLGNFNGNNTDDFVLPNGQVLSNNLTEKQILSMFCLQWAVDNTSTVMRYEARKGSKDYNHPEFQPVFLDELNPSVRREAEGLCGAQNLACIYDFLATGNKDFALSTADQQKLSDDLVKQSKNSLPSVKVPAAVYVTVGVQKTVFINGSDPDVNDRMTYRIVDDAKGAVNINSSSGAITIFLNTLDPIKIQVYVVDEVGGQSTVESLPLVVCSGCEDHGLCNESDTRDVSGDSYFQYAVCQCQPAWTGNNCELDKDGCSDNPCHPLQTCADVLASQQGSSDLGYRCSDCPPGFSSRNGSQDCIDISECDNDSDECDMICTNTYGGYECSCQEGFRLSSDGHTCADVNECLENTHDCRQVCNNTEGGYQCECEPGYSYDEITKDCIMDSSLSAVCQASGCSQGCRVVTDAANNIHAQCFCYLGYDLDTRDNATCVDRDECRDKVCDQVCNNTAGGFSCSCYDGFALNKDERTCSACSYLKYGPQCRETCTCSGRSVACHPVRGCVCQDGWTGKSCEEDVDECAENPDVCGTQKRCVNNKGSFSCVCRPGYESTDDGVCQDIDECSTSNSCSEQEDCTNIPGGFYCTCKVGYIKIASTCTDIDECTLNIADCQQDCVNVPGSFNCECKYGYRLNADRRHCSKVQEVCTDGDVCRQAHGCTLDIQNNPQCFCHSGYQLVAANNTCIDIDECHASVKKCSNECHNEDGSFHCSCPLGMKLDNDGLTCSVCPSGTYGPDCTQVCACGEGTDHCNVTSGCVCRDGWQGNKCDQDVNECQRADICKGENVECVNFIGSYACKCLQGFAQNNSVCQDINECEASICDQHCTNTIGSFHCFCDDGFTWNETTQKCTDVDECASHETNKCKQRCDNTAGSYRCSCSAAGFILNNDGFTCKALTECQRTDCDTQNGGCAVTQGEETCFCNRDHRLLSDGVSCALISGGTTTVLRQQTTESVKISTGSSSRTVFSWKEVGFLAGVVFMLIL